MYKKAKKMASVDVRTTPNTTALQYFQVNAQTIHVSNAIKAEIWNHKIWKASSSFSSQFSDSLTFYQHYYAYWFLMIITIGLSNIDTGKLALLPPNELFIHRSVNLLNVTTMVLFIPFNRYIDLSFNVSIGIRWNRSLCLCLPLIGWMSKY